MLEGAGFFASVRTESVKWNPGHSAIRRHQENRALGRLGFLAVRQSVRRIDEVKVEENRAAQYSNLRGCPSGTRFQEIVTVELRVGTEVDERHAGVQGVERTSGGCGNEATRIDCSPMVTSIDAHFVEPIHAGRTLRPDVLLSAGGHDAPCWHVINVGRPLRDSATSISREQDSSARDGTLLDPQIRADRAQSHTTRVR